MSWRPADTGGRRWTPAPHLPLPAAAPYDVDVVVVGGGPAGLSAAVRARWIKSYRSPPCSVAIFEPGPVGGLAGWRTASLTGPGWRYVGEGLVDQLWADIARYHIPVLGERVTRIERCGAGFLVRSTGGALRCLAVVLACGMRALSNEVRFLHRGLFLTYMGYEYFPRILDRIREVEGGRGLVIVGNERSDRLAPLVASRLGDLAVTWVIEPPAGAAALPGRVIRGRLLQVLGGGGDGRLPAPEDPSRPDYEPAAAAGVRGVRIEGAGELACGAVLLDYNAFELSPATDWDGVGLERAPGGAVAVDAWCATSAPGIFAAGDVTGRYKSTAVALGDGVSAGFGAVRHVHRAKFGREPNLYAYAASDRPLGEGERDIPELDPALLPVALAPLPALLKPLGRSSAARRLLEAADGVADIAALAARAGLPTAAALALVEAMMELKLGTVHTPLSPESRR